MVEVGLGWPLSVYRGQVSLETIEMSLAMCGGWGKKLKVSGEASAGCVWVGGLRNLRDGGVEGRQGVVIVDVFLLPVTGSGV